MNNLRSEALTLPTVVCVTCCTDLETLASATLIFHTIRVGFPAARVLILDNHSLLPAQRIMAREADRTHCVFVPLGMASAPRPTHAACLHDCVLNDAVRAQLGLEQGPLVFVDSDVIFWKSIEQWQFPGALLAGRYIPTMQVPFPTSAVESLLTFPRLHTSLLWLPDVARLRAHIFATLATHDEWDPFAAFQCPSPTHARLWYRLDTAASLYAACRHDAISFTEDHLNAYDHVFHGSHAGALAHMTTRADVVPDYAWFIRGMEAVRRGEYEALRGMWREQEAYFQARSIERVGVHNLSAST